jgi:glycosyltransferase involved in cell wall biosynthesis
MVLFGAINADPRKGIEHLERLVHRTADRGYRYFVFGPPPREGGFQCPGVTFLGTVSDEVSLSELYSAADVFLAPSLEDNLPNTVLESMACGTPVVSFKDSGGVVDVIEHLDSGYLADRSQPDGLEQGVTWTLDANRTRMLSEKVRGRIVPRFTLDRQVDQYVELYRALLQRGAPGDSMGQGYSEST